ncbi:sensor domain-containing diguanylate cyclase [Candidatus Methylobacter oryzae]|uniref:diguanylate cyclase n=1 Tax=Candidatus Methylobacter oryzae TaxID=2497749 RepID=A0ABY3C7J5_9GAMM|nr:sensor domain-containing diguanylate cyclase [Candidatus Methylobacter oryzae]TRW90797.1 sensor domain-containing diguanylate cyclase [Candidatus Methylobacter oryzae]
MEEDLTTDLVALQSHLETMLERIQRNSATLRKFQAFEIRLLKLNALPDIIDHLLEEAKNYFDLDAISLCLLDEAGEIAKTLNDSGYSCSSKNGLILLDTLKPAATQPYIGIYRNAQYADFFPHIERQPASVAITPLTRRDKFMGTLNLGSYQLDRFDDKMATDFIEHLSSVVGVCLENNLHVEEIRRVSYLDALTGVNNRRFFEQRIGEELKRSQRNAAPLSCQFFDIDFFKSINDKYGHQGGDLVLSLVATTIKHQLRDNDVFVRYGGEEFVALLSNTDEFEALETAERVRKAIQTLVIAVNDISVSVTVSIGISNYVPDTESIVIDSDAANLLIKAADSALYRAKHNGRNRVENGGIVANKRMLSNKV